MSLSPRDLFDWRPRDLFDWRLRAGDFIALKQMAAREIALALGVPPMLLGRLD